MKCNYCDAEFDVIFNDEERDVEYCPSCGEPHIEELDFN